MGSRREGYHGGEFVVFKREAAKTNDFCCICDYREREKLPPYTATRMFHEGEQIAFIRYAGLSSSWDRAHSGCATKELERQQTLAAEQLTLSVVPPNPTGGAVPRARVSRLSQYEGRFKYQVLIDHDNQSWEVMRFSVKDEAIGAAKLINGWDPSVARRVLAVAQSRALVHGAARGA